MTFTQNVNLLRMGYMFYLYQKKGLPTYTDGKHSSGEFGKSFLNLFGKTLVLSRKCKTLFCYASNMSEKCSLHNAQALCILRTFYVAHIRWVWLRIIFGNVAKKSSFLLTLIENLHTLYYTVTRKWKLIANIFSNMRQQSCDQKLCFHVCVSSSVYKSSFAVSNVKGNIFDITYSAKFQVTNSLFQTIFYSYVGA